MPSVQQDRQRDLPEQSARVLDYSGRGLRRIKCLPEGWSPVTLLLHNNEISTIENLQYMAHLQQLSLADNHLVEMKGIGQGQGLRVLDLSNNSIIIVEDLSQLKILQWLNLSGNSIQHIENLNRNIQLTHLDLSDNSIEVLSDLSFLINLKTLLLHGNLISSLKFVGRYLPASIITLSLAENEILDLNEMSFLSNLSNLEQLSIANNTCVIMTPPSFAFDYRPYLMCCCPKLRNLDGQLVSQVERFKADKMSRTGHLRLFSPGCHTQLVAFLSHVCPLPQMGQQTDAVNAVDQPGERGTDAQKERPPTATHESTSGFDAKSAAAQDDVTSDDDTTDQLRSESRYLPIFCPSPPAPRKDDNSQWSVNTRPYTAPPQENAGRDLETRPATVAAGGRSQWDPVVSGSVERSGELGQDPNDSVPIMTEQEALRLFSLAATIIQAHVRGYLVRRRLNFREYKKRNRAAVLIQATWRGYHARTYNIKVISIRNDIRARRFQSYLRQLSIALHSLQGTNAKHTQLLMEAIKSLYEEVKTVKEMNQRSLLRERSLAASKIQSLWRGYSTRKEYPRLRVRSLDRYNALLTFCQRLQQQVNVLTDCVQEMKRDQRAVRSHHEASELSMHKGEVSSKEAESPKDTAFKGEGDGLTKEVPDKEGVKGSRVHNQVDLYGDNAEGPTHADKDQGSSTSEGPSEREWPSDDTAERNGPGDDSWKREEPGDDSCGSEAPGEETYGGHLFRVEIVNVPEIIITSPVTTDEGRSSNSALSDMDYVLESSEVPCDSGKTDENLIMSEQTNNPEGPVQQHFTPADTTKADSGKPETAGSEPANSQEARNDASSSSAVAYSTEVSLDLIAASHDSFVESNPADLEYATIIDGEEVSLGLDPAIPGEPLAEEEVSLGLSAAILGEPLATEEDFGDVEEAKRMDEDESGGSSLESTLKASHSVPESAFSAKEIELDSEQEDGDVSSAEPEDHQSDGSSVEDDGVDSLVVKNASDDEKDQAHSSHEAVSHLEGNNDKAVSDEAFDEEEIPASRPLQETSTKPASDSKKPSSDSKEQVSDYKKPGSDAKEHVSDSKEHVSDSKKLGSDSMEHVPDSKEHVPDSKEHVPDSKKLVSDSKEHVTDSKRPGSISKEHIPDSKEHVPDSKEHVSDSNKIGSDSMEHVPDSKEHVPDSKEHVPDSKENVPDSKKLVSDSKKPGSDSKEHVPDSKKQRSDYKKHVLARSRSDDTPFSNTAYRGISPAEQPTRSYLPLRPSSSLGPKASSIFSELRSEIAALKAKHKAGIQASSAWTKQVERELEPATSLSSALDKTPRCTESGSSVLENDANTSRDCLENTVKGDKLVEKIALECKQSLQAGNLSEQSDNVLVGNVPSDFDKSTATDIGVTTEIQAPEDMKRGLPLFEDIERSSFSAEDYFTDNLR